MLSEAVRPSFGPLHNRRPISADLYASATMRGRFDAISGQSEAQCRRKLAIRRPYAVHMSPICAYCTVSLRETTRACGTFANTFPPIDGQNSVLVLCRMDGRARPLSTSRPLALRCMS